MVFSNDGQAPQSQCSVKDSRVFVFDFGGVVGGTDHALVSQEVAKRLDMTVDEATPLVEQMFEARKQGVQHTQFWHEYAAKTNRQLPEDWDTFIEEAKCRSIQANPEMLALAKSLRQHGYTVAMLSDTTPQRAQVIREAGFYDPFDPVVLSYEINAAKPDQKAFQLLLQKLNTRPEQCVFIDNAPVNVSTAKEMGFDAILFTTIDGLKSELRIRNIQFD